MPNRYIGLIEDDSDYYYTPEFDPDLISEFDEYIEDLVEPLAEEF